MFLVSEVVFGIDALLNCHDFELNVAVLFQLCPNCWKKRLGIRRNFVENIFNVPFFSRIFSKMFSIVASIFSETFEALNC